EAHSLNDTCLFVVTGEASPDFERACKAAGAGLLVINDDNEFSLVIDFAATLPAPMEQEFQQNVQAARRHMELLLETSRDDLRIRREKVAEHTRGMPDKLVDEYLDNIERQVKIWEAWVGRISRRLDDVLAARDEAGLGQINIEIDEGP